MSGNTVGTRAIKRLAKMFAVGDLKGVERTIGHIVNSERIKAWSRGWCAAAAGCAHGDNPYAKDDEK